VVVVADKSRGAADENYSCEKQVKGPDGNLTNKTVPQPNICHKYSGRPHCLPVIDYKGTRNYRCLECDPATGVDSDCQCMSGYYCVKDIDNDEGELGTCQPYTPSKLGQPCAEFATVDDQPGHVLTNLSDSMFCGKAVYGLDGKASGVEWQGECVHGTCQVCRNTAFFTTAKGIVNDPTQALFPNAICGDRVCLHGRYYHTSAVLFSVKNFWANPVIYTNVLGMAFVMIASVSFIVYGLLILFRDNKKKAAGGKGGDYKAVEDGGEDAADA